MDLTSLGLFLLLMLGRATLQALVVSKSGCHYSNHMQLYHEGLGNPHNYVGLR